MRKRQKGQDLHPAFPFLCLLPIEEHRHSALLQGCKQCHQGQSKEYEAQHIPTVALCPILKDACSVSNIEPQQDGAAFHPADTTIAVLAMR